MSDLIIQGSSDSYQNDPDEYVHPDGRQKTLNERDAYRERKAATQRVAQQEAAAAAKKPTTDTWIDRRMAELEALPQTTATQRRIVALKPLLAAQEEEREAAKASADLKSSKAYLEVVEDISSWSEKVPNLSPDELQRLEKARLYLEAEAVGAAREEVDSISESVVARVDETLLALRVKDEKASEDFASKIQVLEDLKPEESQTEVQPSEDSPTDTPTS